MNVGMHVRMITHKPQIPLTKPLLTRFISFASQMITDRSLEPEIMYLPSREKQTDST